MNDMKKHLTGLIGVFAFLTSLGAFASDLWEAEKFQTADLFYSKWGERHGGGFLLGGEYVPQTLKYGIGFRLGLGAYFADQKALDRGGELTFPLGLYLPVHITESLAVYAGGGLDLHAAYITTREDEGLQGDYKGYGVTENLFAGVRYNFSISGDSSVFVFAEYCQDFGEIPVKHEKTVITNRDKKVYKDKHDVDMSGSRFLVGIGFLGW